MITVLDMILIFIASIFLILLSVSFFIIPFVDIGKDSIVGIISYLNALKGNYILILIGVVILFMGLKLASILFRRNKKRLNELYIDQWTEYGEVRISGNTIVGLVKAECDKFSGLKNINVGINILEGKIIIEIRGQTSPEINIPEITKEIQKRVKNHVETCTGVEVSEVKIYIENVSQPVRNLR